MKNFVAGPLYRVDSTLFRIDFFFGSVSSRETGSVSFTDRDRLFKVTPTSEDLQLPQVRLRDEPVAHAVRKGHGPESSGWPV